MSDYYTPASNFQTPDIIGDYLRGQQAGFQQSMQPLQRQSAQLAVQQQQQGVEQGALNLQQLRLMMGLRQQALQQYQSSSAPTAGTAPAGASNAVASSGGVQNGPQGTVGVPQGTAPALQSGNSYDGSFGVDPTTYAKQQGSLEYLMTMDPAKAQEAQKAAFENRQQQQQWTWKNDNSVMGEAFLRHMALNKTADQDLTAPGNQNLWNMYPQLARATGVDPQPTAANINRVAQTVYNRRASQLSLPPISNDDLPVYPQSGPYGQQLTVGAGGKTTEVAGRQIPSYTMEKSVDIDTGKTSLNPVMTGGLTQGGQAPYGTAGSSGQIPLGYTSAPTQDESKTAAFASAFQTADKDLREKESQGFQLSAPQRAALISVMSSEDPSVIKGTASQEYLLHVLGPDAKEYLAAAYPLIEAVSHNQSGVRLPGNVIRAQLESSIPTDVNDPHLMRQVYDYRNSVQNSLDVGSGTAAFTGEFKGSIGQRRINSARTITRTGTHNGQKVVQYSDGSIEPAQ